MPMDSGIEPEASSPVSFVRLSINRPAGQEPIGGLQLAVCGLQFPVQAWHLNSYHKYNNSHMSHLLHRAIPKNMRSAPPPTANR